MRKQIINWIKRQFEWHRLWRQLLDLTWISKVGRDCADTCRIASFKAFEAWVSAAQERYDASDLEGTNDAVRRASASFARLNDAFRKRLYALAQSARREEYRMRVAQLCQ
ncbi:MAG: hypothetical protein K2X93_25030 [Candidatus Obscuribacterales bacterium]|nr:hypothetical protein [Candidatus Obscuribacterales bacterium]